MADHMYGKVPSDNRIKNKSNIVLNHEHGTQMKDAYNHYKS